MMLAAINKARPYSNAHQECDFSMATWFDSNLFQRQKPQTLEMRLVGSLNRLVVKQMWCLLQKLKPAIVKVIDVYDISNVEDDNQYDKDSDEGLLRVICKGGCNLNIMNRMQRMWSAMILTNTLMRSFIWNDSLLCV